MGSGTGLLAVQYTTAHADVIEQTIRLLNNNAMQNDI